MFDGSPRGSGRPRSCFGVTDALKVNANFILFRRPRLSEGVAALAAAVFTAKFNDGLVARRSQEVKRARQAWIGGKCQFIQGFFDHLFRVWNGEVAYIYAALCSPNRLHFFISICRTLRLTVRCPSRWPHGPVPRIGCIARSGRRERFRF